jgi:hypothetical protein
VRCSRCGSRVRFMVAGMGNSDAPGCYFFTGLLFALVAVSTLAVAGVLWSWWWLPWAGLSAGAAALLVWWSSVAIGDGYGNRCEACGQQHQSRPWSL